MKKRRFFIPVLFAICCSATVSAQQIRGTFAIKNVETGIVLRIKDANTKNGTPVVAYSPVNWKCVTWDVKQVEGQTYTLTNLYSGKTLQPQVPEIKDGVPLEEQPLQTGNKNQLYEFIPIEKNQYLIRLKNTELYLTPSDDNGNINANIILAQKNNANLQRWTLQEQKPTI
jgi:hypothetical protein